MKKYWGNYQLIIIFCIIAAIRVFIYSAAFPFFNNVDEEAHFDMVMKYSQGHIPHALEFVSPNSAACIALYGSPEYLVKPSYFTGGRYPTPLWKLPKEKVQNYIDMRMATWSSITNHESTQPPLYYMIAGGWANLGSLFGLKGGWFLYWIRFLNVFLVVALVWISYLAASRVFPENRFIVLGVPLLAAILPQDTYYSIQSDVLSPLFFGLAFIGIVWFMRAEIPELRHGIFTGLAVAATVFVKTSNLVILVVVLVTLLFKVYKLLRARKLLTAALPIGLFALFALTPVILWFAWNLSTYGDITASESKIRVLGWTHKSFFDWFSHPIFTLQGVWIFWSELISSFWRGEFVWSLERLAMPLADTFYWLSSFVFVVLTMINIRRKVTYLQRQINWFSFWSFASLIILLGLLSVSFDFGRCFYPSQEHPYFTSGRLISAALIPFLLLYVQGLNRAFSWIKSERSRFFILIAIVIFVTISELIVNWPVFSSHFNLFHM